MTPSRALRPVAVLVLAALAGAACGADSDDAVPLPLETTTSASASTSTVQTTTTESGSAAPLLGEVIEAIPDAGVHPLMTGAFAAVNQAADACGDLTAWTEHMTTAVTRFEKLIPRVQSSPALTEWRGSREARALSDAIRDRLVLQDRCVDGATTATDEQEKAALQVTGRAVAIADWYRIRLYQLPPSVGAEMWYQADQLGHLIEIERLIREPGGVDLVIAGTSRVRRGINAVTLSNRTDATAVNVGIPLMYPTVMMPWLRQVRRRVNRPEHMVIGVGATDAFRGCTQNRIEKMRQSVLLQEGAFATLPVLAEVDRERVLVGPRVPSYTDSPVLRSYRSTTVPNGNGTGITAAGPDPAAIELDRARYVDLLTDPMRCGPIVTELGPVVRDLTKRGIDVLVVGMPIHPEVRAMPPRGGDLLDLVTAEQAALTEEAGGRFVDLSTLLAADEFADLTDPNEAGRRRLTLALVSELER